MRLTVKSVRRMLPDMTDRFDNLEEIVSQHGERLAALEAIIPTLATKNDLLQLKAEVFREFGQIRAEMHAQTWRLIGVCAGLVAATYFIARYVR